jgi:hypothetical protein
MRKVLWFFCLCSALLLPPLRAASPKDLAARWIGYWTAPEGWIYRADTVLEVDNDNAVTGVIQWTLLKSPRPEEQAKLGLTGTEHVQGTFLPEAGAVRMEGVSLDDPNHILGVDKYRLILSDDAMTLGGITFHGGTWNAQILLRKP